MRVKAVIFGVYSQDAVFLSRVLKAAGYEIIGVRNLDRARKEPILSRCKVDEIVDVSFSSVDSLLEVFGTSGVEKIFNLVGFSSVSRSFLDPITCQDVNFIFYQRLLEAARLAQSGAHIVQCSSSEMYAGTDEPTVNEDSELSPVSPYGVSKAASHLLTRVYRNTYQMKVSSAVLFNHESEYRPANFFTKKAILGMIDIHLGREKFLRLEKIDFERDWSYAGDVAKAMSLIASSPKPGEFVVSSGKLRSGREFLEVGLRYLGVNSELDDLVTPSEESARPFDHRGIAGDSSKIRNELGWKPDTRFEEIVKIMIDFELQNYQS